MIGNTLYLWGGNQADLPNEHNDEKKRLTSHVELFNFTTGKWDSKPTKGYPPLGVVGYFSTTLKDHNKIYYFGGYCGHEKCYHNSLNELDTSTLTWMQLSATNDTIAVMKRGYGGMMPTEFEGGHHLLLIGGFASGAQPSIQLPQAQYIEMQRSKWLTNECNMYDLSSG